jgi:pyridoxamine 5'-phosphate oxidase
MKIDNEIAGIRREYDGTPLDESSVDSSPFAQFGSWFDEAVRADIPLANGTALTTVSRDGQPSGRIVLLKEFDDSGFVFFTNYNSSKGDDLAHNPKASLLFWWVPLQRQVRIQGVTSMISPAESDEYFASRPRASNVSALASSQSETVVGRSALEADVTALEQRLAGNELVRPARWGGYRLAPTRFEFWQGRLDRLHDRICYTPTATDQGSGWAVSRLAP